MRKPFQVENATEVRKIRKNQEQRGVISHKPAFSTEVGEPHVCPKSGVVRESAVENVLLKSSHRGSWGAKGGRSAGDFAAQQDAHGLNVLRPAGPGEGVKDFLRVSSRPLKPFRL